MIAARIDRVKNIVRCPSDGERIIGSDGVVKLELHGAVFVLQGRIVAEPELDDADISAGTQRR